MYIPSVNNVRYDLEELMRKYKIGSSQGCTVFRSSDEDGFASTMGVLEEGFFVDSVQLSSIPRSSSGGTNPYWNPSGMDDNIFDLEDLFPDEAYYFANSHAITKSLTAYSVGASSGGLSITASF
ncbi:hypothetical protein CQW23_26666 [Capsicum baccatum]|uniref:Uncharacterized protein n=1 Tax=Capsicum baccatum TaxID=33114 RepID=A0A2G2VPH2_CAPBA|nr:hypothetical protein CQW23_26666 [Capsicum baccatum]